MQCVTILYPNQPGAKFNFEYYLNTHLPLWRPLIGEGKLEARKGICTHNGSPAHYLCILRIWIDDMDRFMMLMKTKGHHIIKDIPNYTNVEPIIQYDQVLVSSEVLEQNA